MKDKRFGSYYGELVRVYIDSDLKFTDIDDTEDLIQQLLDVGVREIYFDINDGNDYSDTMFFSTDKLTDFKELMIIIACVKPDEFSEESPYNYRMWFD